MAVLEDRKRRAPVATRSPSAVAAGLTAHRMPRFGQRYDIAGDTGGVLSVLIDRRGRRHLAIHPADGDGYNDVVVLTEAEASLLALVLTGTYELAREGWAETATA
jgi:hypothetical protein